VDPPLIIDMHKFCDNFCDSDSACFAYGSLCTFLLFLCLSLSVFPFSEYFVIMIKNIVIGYQL